MVVDAIIVGLHSHDPTAMFSNKNKRKRLRNNTVQFPEDWVEVPTKTWPPFLCLGVTTTYWL